MSEGAKTLHSATAAARDDIGLRAVKVRRSSGSAEILWAKSLPAADGSWSELAAECGLARHRGAEKRVRDKHNPCVVGLDATAVAFYRITAPTVGKEETEAIVRMQAESLLPLQPEQIAVAWRSLPTGNGKLDITIAAARRDHLFRFANGVQDFGAPDIFLSCEGLAKAWQRLFVEGQREAIVVSVGRRDTQVCLIQNGLVAYAAVLTTGLRDLAAVDDSGAASEQTELTERFAQDMRTAIESFGNGGNAARHPIYVLSDGSEAIDHVISSLNAAGLSAQPSLPSVENLKMPADLGLRDLYDYRVPIGLALMALEAPSEALNLFEGVDEEEKHRRAQKARRSIVLAGALAVVMLAAFLAVAYAADVTTEKRLRELVDLPQFERARQRTELLKTVARHRPDLLQLLTDTNGGENKGIVLDAFHFKKGQKVALVGHADKEEGMWKFQQDLRGRKGIENVDISAAVPDKKTKKIKFTITFDYKTFTKKSGVL